MKSLLLLAALLLLASRTSAHAAEPTEKFFIPQQDKAGLNPDPPVDAKLPKVLILGDSISIGYTLAVRRGLAGTANVVRPKANCGDTPMGLAHIDEWLGDEKWDVIHFNWGLWDLCYRNPAVKTQGNRDKVNGKLSVPIPDYEKNLETLVLRLKRTGATLIFATTTVVPDGEVGRIVGDELKYNEAAKRIMEKHDVRIDDLYATTHSFGPEMFGAHGDVHYTGQGYQKLAEQVVATVKEALNQPKKTTGL